MSDSHPAAQGCLDLDELKRRIRELAAIRRGGPVPEAPADQSGSAAWSGVFAGLTWAEEHADLVHANPAMLSFPRAVRPLARLVGRVVLVLSRFLTRQQTDCNNATLTALHLLGATVRRRLDELDSRVARIENAVRELEQRLEQTGTDKQERRAA